MKYMLLCYADEQVLEKLSDTEHQQKMDEVVQLAYQLKPNGQFLGSARLHPTSTATSVRVREGKSLITDGPFAETREQLGGYFLIDAADLQEATHIAVRFLGKGGKTVEIRQVMELPGLPTS